MKREPRFLTESGFFYANFALFSIIEDQVWDYNVVS